MTVQQDLVHPDLHKVLLIEATCGQHIDAWTLDTGTTYYAEALYNIIDVKEDGVSLTSQTSIVLVDANPGSYYYANNRVYVHTSLSADPYTLTIQAILMFYYSDSSKNINNQYYEPRLENSPNMSLRVEPTFTGISQISGGNLTLSNADGFFDDLVNLQWDAGTIVMLLGTEVNKAVKPYSDYITMATWLINDWDLNDTKFSLTLSEYKVKIKKKIPFEFYKREDYPNIEVQDIGRPIQIAYGIIKDASPALIDISLRKFKVAGHGINEFEQVRVLDESSGAWVAVSYESTDLANGEFTLFSSDWTYNQAVAVDFKGKEKYSGLVMDNASDIVRDILDTYLGETSSINIPSFDEAFRRLDAGRLYRSQTLVPYKGLGVYISETQQVQNILEKINTSVGSYLFANTSGEFIYRVFWPERSEGLLEINDDLITDFSEKTDNTSVYSKASVTYDYRYVREWGEIKTFENKEYQYIHDEQVLKLVENETYLYDSDDAATASERLLNYEGKPLKTYSITVPAREALLLLPSDFIRMVYSRHNIDGVYEVLTVSHNLRSSTTSLMLGDAHGLKDESGFWVAASDLLPVRFANEAGYNGGSLVWNDLWSNAIATWAIQNVGYWTDINGYASQTQQKRSLQKSTWV